MDGSFVKLRGFLLNEMTGSPVGGALVSAWLVIEDGKIRRRTPLAVMATDRIGFVSFAVPERAIAEASGHSVEIGVGGKDDVVAKLPCSSLLAERPRIGFISTVDQASVTLRALPSIALPDDIDREVSPASFGTDRALVIGDGSCEQVVPSGHPVRTFRFHRVATIASAPDVREEKSRVAASAHDAATVMIDVDSDPVSSGDGAQLQLGRVFEYEQTWYPAGSSLGEIAYSLTLAPGEAVNLAMIDWSRTDRISREDSVISREALVHDQRRDRTIDEAVEAALKEVQYGYSMMGGAGGGAKGGAGAVIPVEGIPVTLQGAGNLASFGGGGITYSSGKRDLTADLQQDVHDRVRQASSSIRSLTSTVIVQGHQSESNVLQTRRVANHNRCHALTIQYYHVLTQYRVVTEFQRSRAVVLIPFKLARFDAERAFRWSTILRPMLLDADLSTCFGALDHLLNCSDHYPSNEAEPARTNEGPSPPVATSLVNSFFLTLHTGERQTWGGIQVLLELEDGSQLTLWTKPAVNEGIHEVDKENRTLTANSDRNEEIAATGNLRIDPALVRKVIVKWIESNGADAWKLDHLRLSFRRDGQEGYTYFKRAADNSIEFNHLFDNSGKEWLPEDRGLDPLEEDTPQLPASPDPEATSGSETRKKADDECCAARLLAHLNAHLGYYNRAIWLLQDPTERRLLLNKAFGPAASAIDDQPLAVSGQHVAFAFDDPRESNILLREDVQAALAKAIDDPELLNKIWNSAADGEALQPAPVTASVSYIALPTRGLFAEAELGRCNGCEQRDISRMWDWRELPEPPELSALTPGPKGQAPSISPASLPQNVLQVMTPPAIPDPTGLAAALAAITKGDSFRDMSGISSVEGLLGKIADGSAKSLDEASGLAKTALEFLDKTKTAAPSATEPSPESAQQHFDRTIAAKEVAKAAEELGLPPAEKKALVSDTLRPSRKRTTPKPGARLLLQFVDVYGQPTHAVYTWYLDDLAANDDYRSPVPEDTRNWPGAIGIGKENFPQLTRGVLQIGADFGYGTSISGNLNYALAAGAIDLRARVQPLYQDEEFVVEQGQTLGEIVKKQLAGEFEAGGAIKVIELSLKASGQLDWEDTMNATQTSTRKFTLRVPQPALALTQL